MCDDSSETQNVPSYTAQSATSWQKRHHPKDGLLSRFQGSRCVCVHVCVRGCVHCKVVLKGPETVGSICWSKECCSAVVSTSSYLRDVC